MGCMVTQETIPLSPLPNTQNRLRVFSLNFCGILKSPFEFYSGKFTQLAEQLSCRFKKLLEQHFREQTLEKISQIIGSADKKTKDYRYSPLYNITVGIQENKFINGERFRQLWKQSFGNRQENKPEQLLDFDLLVYRSLLQHVYSIADQNEAGACDPQAYLELYSPLFSQSFLEKEGQISKLKNSIDQNSFDVLFIQQASPKLVQVCRVDERFFVSLSSDQDTMILANKSSFRQLKDNSELQKRVSDQQWKSLNWNGHTSVMVIDQFILISGHLASKKAANEQNVKDLKEILPLLRNKFSEYHLVCGCDCNAFVPQFSSDINVFPEIADRFTTLKKRTWMQAQFSKAEKIIKETKDQIFTTLKILTGEVLLINGSQVTQQSFLPLEQHPYDHFLVRTELQRPL